MFACANFISAVTLSLVATTMAAPAPNVLFPRQTQNVIPDNCSRNLTVYLGETCDIISDYYSVSQYQLEYVNTGRINSDCSNLAEGEPLCIGITGQDCTTTHIVTPDDDGCWNIATNAGIPLDTLLANNPNVDSACDNIYPGEVLCIASELIEYTTIANYTGA